MSTKFYLFVQGTRSLVARGRDASLMTFWVEAHEKMQEKTKISTEKPLEHSR